MFAVVLALALQQAPLAEDAPSLSRSARLEALELAIREAPRGWPRAQTISLISSLGGMTGFALSTVMLAATPVVAFAIAPVLIAGGLIGFVSAVVSQISAAISLLSCTVEARKRRDHILALEAERAALSP